MAETDSATLLQCIERVKCLTEDVECFLHGRQSTASLMLDAAKFISDLSYVNGHTSIDNGRTLKELHVDNFDMEQVWQMIQMNNEPLVEQLRRKVRRMNFEQLSTIIKNNDTNNDKIDRKACSDERLGSIKDSFSALSDDEEPEQHECDDFVENSEKFEKNQKRKKISESIVDDNFFVLAEMNKFLDMEDKKFENKHIVDSVNEIDYFDDQLSELDSLNELDDAVEQSRNMISRKSKKKRKIDDAGTLMFADYFDPPGHETSVEKKANKILSDHDMEDNDIASDLEQDNSSDEIEEMEDISEDVHGDKNRALSKHTLERNKMKEKIKLLEDQNVSKKKWQETGEITATTRPLNSLLEENLTFDQTLVRAPTVTEETTNTLEDLIKQRIKDEAWDDAVRVVKPKETSYEYKKSLSLDQEKSKISLAEVYEKEFIKQTQNTKEDENPEHETIKTMMHDLFSKLDALSNYTFTPKQVQPDLKVVSNLPSIEVEEYTPVTISTEAMLAPEEIFDKKRHELKGDTEKSVTDRKRERREKKTKKREQIKSKAKRNGVLKRDSLSSAKRSKSEKKNAKIVDDGSQLRKMLKSSTSFFTQLQENAEERVSKIKKKANKKEGTKRVVEEMKL